MLKKFSTRTGSEIQSTRKDDPLGTDDSLYLVSTVADRAEQELVRLFVREKLNKHY